MRFENDDEGAGAYEGLLERLQVKIGYRFKNSSLLRDALVHKSFANEKQLDNVYGNERLEFLGDAVLGVIISHILMDRVPGCSEGKLSNMRAAIVNEDELSALARAFDLGECLRLSKGEDENCGRDKKSILANAFEALIAAVYYDSGYQRVFSLVEQHCSPLIDEVAQKGYVRDYKSRLQEYALRTYNVTPRYVLVLEEGPDHGKMFQSQVCIGNKSFETGQGASKKASEQDAAEKTLNRLQAETT